MFIFFKNFPLNSLDCVGSGVPETLDDAYGVAGELTMKHVKDIIFRRLVSRHFPLGVLEFLYTLGTRFFNMDLKFVFSRQALFQHEYFKVGGAIETSSRIKDGYQMVKLFDVKRGNSSHCYVEVPKSIFERDINAQDLKLYQLIRHVSAQSLAEVLSAIYENSKSEEDSFVPIPDFVFQNFNVVVEDLVGHVSIVDDEKIPDDGVTLSHVVDPVTPIEAVSFAFDGFETLAFIGALALGVSVNPLFILFLATALKGDNGCVPSREAYFNRCIRDEGISSLPIRQDPPPASSQWMSLLGLGEGNMGRLCSFSLPVTLFGQAYDQKQILGFQYASQLDPESFSKFLWMSQSVDFKDPESVKAFVAFVLEMTVVDFSRYDPLIARGVLFPIEGDSGEIEFVRRKLELLIPSAAVKQFYGPTVGGIFLGLLHPHLKKLLKQLPDAGFVFEDGRIFRDVFWDCYCKGTSYAQESLSLEVPEGKLAVKLFDSENGYRWFYVPDRLGEMLLDVEVIRAYQLAGQFEPERFVRFLNTIHMLIEDIYKVLKDDSEFDDEGAIPGRYSLSKCDLSGLQKLVSRSAATSQRLDSEACARIQKEAHDARILAEKEARDREDAARNTVVYYDDPWPLHDERNDDRSWESSLRSSSRPDWCLTVEEHVVYNPNSPSSPEYLEDQNVGRDFTVSRAPNYWFDLDLDVPMPHVFGTPINVPPLRDPRRNSYLPEWLQNP